MLLHAAIRKMAGGERLELLATDPSTARDVPRFCQFLGHELEEESQNEGAYRYLIRKKID